MAKAKRNPDEPTIVKKYANRRLYDTGRSSYVTLDDLCEMVKEGHDFVVQDAKNGEDITRSVLTQIIVEQESKDGEDGGMLPIGFLRQLIGIYGDSTQGLVPNYLENTLETFVKNQEQVRAHINKSLEGMNTMKGMFPSNPALEELNRKNMEMFERTMQMFRPFGGGTSANQDQTKEDKIKDLKENIAEMEKEIERIVTE